MKITNKNMWYMRNYPKRKINYIINSLANGEDIGNLNFKVRSKRSKL